MIFFADFLSDFLQRVRGGLERVVRRRRDTLAELGIVHLLVDLICVFADHLANQP